MEPGRSLEYDPRFFWAIMNCWVALAGWLLNLPDVVLWEELGTLWSPCSLHPCDLRGCLLTQLYCRVNPWEAHKSLLGPSCFSSQCHPLDAGWGGLVLILQLGKPFVVFHSGMSNFFSGTKWKVHVKVRHHLLDHVPLIPWVCVAAVEPSYSCPVLNCLPLSCSVLVSFIYLNFIDIIEELLESWDGLLWATQTSMPASS